MKLDKETVIKQRFWFLLPVFAICLLVSWICVLGVRSETETNYKTATDKDKTLKGIATTSELKNPNWIEAMTKEFDTSAAKKNELWDMEADRQSKISRDGKERKIVRKTPFITWPDRTRAQWMKTSGGRDLYEMDFGEFLGNVPKDEYLEEYRPQFESVASIIKDWLDESNPNNVTGAVRVLGASGNNRNYVIPRLLIPYGLDHSKHVLSDEIYLLQEDLAVKREIFTSLAELLDSYSKLKTEWNEVPYVEIKEAAAPAAPVAAAAGTPAADATNPAAPAAAAAKKDPEPEVYQSYRFYNYIWPNFLNTNEVEQDAKLKATVVDLKLPAVDPYKGWRLDFTVGQDPKDEKKLVLRTVSGNHSSVYTLPVQPLMIWYAELGTDKEVATPLFLNDAGNVGPSEYWPNLTIKKISQKKLNDIPLPSNFGRITRITRVHPENALDQQVVFNNDWALNVQLVRRANSPTLTLRGEIINRSGRRLPVAAFTAGLTLPNTDNLLNEEFKVATDAFNAGERRTFMQEVKNPIPPRTISVVKQKLTWRSTPIKRIDRLEIGRVAHNNSDRLKTLPLVPYDFKRKDPLNQNVVAPVAPSGGAAGPGNLSSEGGGAVSGGGMLGGTSSGGTDSAPTATANHGIPLQRYVQVSSELRRMPVALVMVVDATAMTDIIAAMSNSRLRFQVTMAPWTKVPNLGRPGNAPSGASAPPPGPGASQGPTGAAGGGKAGGVGGGSGGTGPTGGGASLSAGGGVVGAGAGSGGSGPGAGSGQGPGAGAGNTPPPAGEIGLGDDSSVVELQIYGLVTVYESPDEFKRMEKLKANPPAATTATPGTPSTGSAPGK